MNFNNNLLHFYIKPLLSTIFLIGFYDMLLSRCNIKSAENTRDHHPDEKQTVSVDFANERSESQVENNQINFD